MKRFHIYIFMIFALVLMCGGEAEAAKVKKIKTIAFKKYDKTLTIKKGESLKLNVTITPKKATNKKLKWKSSKKKVVSVNSKGVIKGKKKGSSTITVQTTDGTKLKLKLKVTVGQKVNSIAFSNRDQLKELVVGETFRLKTQILPSNASNKKLIWTSSNAKVATVDSKGNITGKSNGVVKITAKATDGTNKKVSTTITVVTKMKSVKLSLKSKSAYCTALNEYAVYMKKGSKCTLETEIKPATTSNKTLEWSSSNPKVATVSSDGKVQTVGVGVTLITAKSIDGSNEKDTFTIYVGRLKKEDCKFVAHRGRSEKAPDNSKAAIQLALASDFDYVEFDIWKTLDNQFVVTHDESLKETCGVDVKVTEITLPQAMSYKIITGNNIDTYPNEYIPSLEQILVMAQAYPDKHLFIELKQVMPKEILQSLLDLLEIYGVMDRVTIITFYENNIKTIRAIEEANKKVSEDANEEPGEEAGEEAGGEAENVLPMQYLSNTPDDKTVQFCIDYKVGLGAKYNSISEDQIKALHQSELEANVWGVPNFLTVCYMVNTMKVDSVTTDYLFFE